MNGVLRQGLQRYFTDAQLAVLGRAKIGIAGAGGLGSNCAAFLVRSGVRRFVLADFDRVEPSNLNRQWYYPDDVGQLKVDALARHLRRLEPDLDLVLHPVRLDEANVSTLFAGCDVLVEAFDDPAAKAMFVRTVLPTAPFVVGASGLAGTGGAPIVARRVTERFVMVGDGVTEVSSTMPPLAPRVMQASGLQADAVLSYLLQEKDDAAVS